MLHCYPMVLQHLTSQQGVALPQEPYATPPTYGGLCGGTAAPLLTRSSGRVGMTRSRHRGTSISPTQPILWAGYTSQQGNRLLLTRCMAETVRKVFHPILMHNLTKLEKQMQFFSLNLCLCWLWGVTPFILLLHPDDCRRDSGLREHHLPGVRAAAARNHVRTGFSTFQL